MEKNIKKVLVCVDNLLVVSHDPYAVMKNLLSKYTMKDGSIKEPDAYLGAEIQKWTIDGGSAREASLSYCKLSATKRMMNFAEAIFLKGFSTGIVLWFTVFACHGPTDSARRANKSK